MDELEGVEGSPQLSQREFSRGVPSIAGLA